MRAIGAWIWAQRSPEQSPNMGLIPLVWRACMLLTGGAILCPFKLLIKLRYELVTRYLPRRRAQCTHLQNDKPESVACYNGSGRLESPCHPARRLYSDDLYCQNCLHLGDNSSAKMEAWTIKTCYKHNRKINSKSLALYFSGHQSFVFIYLPYHQPSTPPRELCTLLQAKIK